MAIRLFQMENGSFIISEQIEETADAYILSYPGFLHFMNEGGQLGMSISPLVPDICKNYTDLNTTFTMRKSSVFFADDAVERIAESYTDVFLPKIRSELSGIEVVPAGALNAVKAQTPEPGSNPKGGIKLIK